MSDIRLVKCVSTCQVEKKVDTLRAAKGSKPFVLTLWMGEKFFALILNFELDCNSQTKLIKKSPEKFGEEKNHQPITMKTSSIRYHF